MKLVRVGDKGAECPGVYLADGEIVDTSAVTNNYDEPFFASDGIERLRVWLDENKSTAPRIQPGVRLGAPISRPSKILCIGRNYHEHAAEMKSEAPSEPLVFNKASSALTGPYDSIEIPRDSEKTDWEIELAIIIGKKAKYINEEDALDYVAGYSILNDVSERAFQKEHSGQWCKGKSHDTFAPLGPYLLTTDEVADPQNLDLLLKRNGEVMQRGNTRDMVFSVRYLVAYLSRFMTLLPGDVIGTGTPSGVGAGRTPPRFLQPGDSLRLSIEGFSEQRLQVVASS
ncbi:MAG: fumarylacetoacetate hydrolase family protein [Candidatus Hinthialibacter antarcticus]|nr:fumarylacetoacetate hydrolase family protein [Candidatus Hinthialibacter antarcticus]